MIVSEIFQDAKRFLGQCNEGEIFARLTDAIETLANKGQWEPLLGYMDTAVNSGNLVTLPREVEIPIRVNVDNNPSYARDRLYEFTLNGPGSNSERTGWQWEDRGQVPIFASFVSDPASFVQVSSDASDDGKKIRVYGKDMNGLDISVEITLDAPTTAFTTEAFSSITRVSKDVTAKSVGLYVQNAADIFNGIDPHLIATYAPDETEPLYRQIRLSKTGVTAHIFFRRRTYKITSRDDFIPLHSKMSILMMLKANESYRDGSIDKMALGDAYEKKALAFLKEEQDSRNTFAELASQDPQPIVGLNINNRDSLIAADVYDDAVAIFGKEGKQKTFDRISDALEALSNKSQWDGLDGYIDVSADDYTVTLPRYVEVPTEINIGGRPTFMRNKWFEFHLNGPGSECGARCSWVWDDRGDVVTLVDVSYPQQLLATNDLVEDNGKYIRVFGYDDNDKEIRTINPITNQLDDGLWLPMNIANTVPASNAQLVQRITRIVKDETLGFVKLEGFSVDRNDTNVLGYYYPDETEPNYRRIILGSPCGWVRIRYRKRLLKITSFTDPLHLKSKIALTAMMMSFASLAKGDLQTADGMEQKALQYITEEHISRNPNETFDFQYDTGTSWADPAQGII